MKDANGKGRPDRRRGTKSQTRGEVVEDDPFERLRAAVGRDDLDALALECAPRLKVLGTVGKGGTAKIEAVLDQVLRRTAAKKSLRARHEDNPRSVRRFVREARVTSQLDHPNVVPVHDLGMDPSGRLFFTLKLVEGRNLSEVIHAWRETDVEEDALLDVLDALVKVCDALSLAHSRGVIHCDVKPDNIMLGDHGETYLMDWGSALVLEEPARPAPPPGSIRAVASSGPSLPGDSRDDTVSGTPNYMAPEQANAEIELIGPHTDVFGVGATLYEILAGRPPYAEDEYALTLELAAEGRFARLGEVIELDSVPPLLAEIVARAMAPSIDARYPTIDALRTDLVRYLRGGGTFPITQFEPGEVVVREGDPGERAFIINRGTCDVVKDLDGEPVVVRTLGPGDVFGETALLSPGPRTASVVAVDTVSAQVIRRDALAHELESVRPWLSKLLGTVAQRFREADAQRFARRESASATRRARHATMFLHTFGRTSVEGSLHAGWSALCRELGCDDPARAGQLERELQAFRHFDVDTAADVVTLRDPRAFAARLAAAFDS